MKLRKEQLAVLGKDKAARKRKEFLEELKSKGHEPREESPGGAVVVRDALGGESRVESTGGCMNVTTAERRKFEIRHDGHLQLRGVTDSASFPVEYDYDHKGRMSEIRRGKHSKFGFSYDQFDGLAEVSYPDNTKVEYANDAVGNLVKTVNRNKNIARRSYDSGGRLTSMQDWQGNETKLGYRGFDLPSEVIQPNGTKHEFAFDEDGALTLVTVNGREHAHFLRVDEEGLYKIDYVDDTFSYLKHEKGRVVEAENENGTVKLEYDDYGRLLKEDTDGRVVEYERDELGNLKAIVAPDGRRIEFDHDADHRVNQVTAWGGQPCQVEYHPNGAFKGIRFPNGASVEQGSTEIGLPSSLTIKSPRHSMRPIVESKYEYDLCDRLIRDQREDTEIRYSYDNEGRLKEASSADADLTESFRLDANGNRTADASGACSFNNMNQLTERDGSTYEYDDLGNTTAGNVAGKQSQFRYNGRGQIIEAITPNGKAEYKYDAIGRRILKRFAGKTTRYVWAGSQLLSETTADGSSQRERHYAFLAGRPLPIAMRDGEQTYYFHCGRRSEPLAMTDADGKLVWQAAYTAFGKAIVGEADHRHQPFRLAGQYYDEETGLHYNVARYYSSELGRFLTTDPLREQGGSLNLYNYCDGDPLNRIDPNGEFIFTAIIVGACIGAVIGAAVESYRQCKEIQNGNPDAYDPLKILGAAAVGGLIGAIGGGVGALVEGAAAAVIGTGLVATGVIGAVEGVAASVAEQCAEAKLKGQELDPKKVAKDAAIDGLIGAGIGLLTFGVGGFLARRAKKATQEFIEVNADAIKKSNIVESHADAMSKVAKQRDEVIMVRPVNPDAKDLIANNHPTKNMNMKGKSSNQEGLKGLIPADASKSKLGPDADPDVLRTYDNYNKKALGEPYEVPIKDKDGNITGWQEKPAQKPIAQRKSVDVVDPETGKVTKVDVLADKNGKPITADYDLFAVGPNKKKGHGKVTEGDPNIGTISNTEKGTMKQINKGVKKTGYGGGNTVHHGPANRFDDTLPDADFPITAFTPDGGVHSLGNKDELSSFMADQNKKGYQLEQRDAWGLDPSIPKVPGSEKK